MKGLLLAGGHGTRLRPLTYTGNKHMLPIGNKPMLFYGLEHLRDAGVKDVGIVLGPVKEGVMEAVGDGSKFGIDVTYIEQGEPKGLAHAVMISEDFIDNEPFVMYLGDNLLKQGAKPLVEVFEKEQSDCVIGVAKVEDPSRYGNVEVRNGKVIKLVEKPEKPKSDLALIGIYVFNSIVFEAVKKIKPSWRNELEITDAIQLLLNSGRKVDLQLVSGWWKDTGRPEDILEANRLVLEDLQPRMEGVAEQDAKTQGRVATGKNTVVRRGSIVRGPAVIGQDCEIGPDTYVGPFTSIGDGVTIRGSEVENTIVMNNCHIECDKRIVDSLIGAGTQIISADKETPKGHKFILGELSRISI